MNLDKLRELCMSFPGATEGLKWEDHICFMVAEKIFCMTGEWGGVNLKVLPEEVEEMIEGTVLCPPLIWHAITGSPYRNSINSGPKSGNIMSGSLMT